MAKFILKNWLQITNSYPKKYLLIIAAFFDAVKMQVQLAFTQKWRYENIECKKM